MYIYTRPHTGYPVLLDHIPYWWNTWLTYVTFMRFAFEGVMVNEFQHATSSNASLSSTPEELVLAVYSFQGYQVGYTFPILILNVVAAAAFTWYGMREHKSRITKVEREHFVDDDDDFLPSQMTLQMSGKWSARRPCMRV